MVGSHGPVSIIGTRRSAVDSGGGHADERRNAVGGLRRVMALRQE